MFSALATLPIVGGLEWVTRHAHFHLSRRWTIGIGGGLVSSTWMLVLVAVYLLVR
jgi:hypothetical protein